MTQRDKQIICGLFLSKFDQEGLKHLGFNSFLEAFNALGCSLGARPASIKNYRDEFDPFFPNTRQGWHKRPLRIHCRRVMELFGHVTMQELGDVLSAFSLASERAETLPELSHLLNAADSGPQSPFAKRLITGRAAEKYFSANFETVPQFAGGELIDTSLWGCGFDFKLSFQGDRPYDAVEVKGLREKSGQIQMTDLEYRVSDLLKDRYFLVVVRNFEESPYISVIQNPLGTSLQFTRQSRHEIRLTWSTTISA